MRIFARKSYHYGFLFIKLFQKMLAFGKSMVYNGNCCDIDSEEARGCYPVWMGFPWSECQETRE